MYPRREDKEKALKEVQDKLDELNAEHVAAKTKKRTANSRISTLKREISQTEASLSMLSPSESSEQAGLLAQLSQQQSALSSAEQDVKDANKIINSSWRAFKRSHYESAIGTATTGLTGDLTAVKSRIYTLETLIDSLRLTIEEKNKKKADKEKEEKAVSEKVKKSRQEYEDAKKNGNPNTEN